MRDALLIFDDALDVLGADVDSDTIRLGQANKGEGTVLWWHVLVTTLFEGGTSCHFVIEDSTDNFSSVTRPLIQTDEVLLAELIVGKEIVIGIAWDVYADMRVTAEPTGTFTAGTVKTWIEID